MLLSGCAKPDPVVTPAPASSSKPLFASDEDALAAATKAYAAYLKMSDQIAQEGGVNPQRLSPLVTPEWLGKQIAVFDKFAETGNRQTGTTTFTVNRLQKVDDNGRGEATVVVYVCTDLSSTKILNSSGADVTPADVQTTVPFEESFVSTAERGAVLLLSEDVVWAGKNFC